MAVGCFEQSEADAGAEGEIQDGGAGGDDVLAEPDTQDVSLPTVPAFDDDDAINEYSQAVTAQCPPVSSSTVPGSWQLAMVGETGCTVYHPPGWLTGSQGTYFSAATKGNEAGYFILNGYLEGTAWDEVSIGDALVVELKKSHPDMKVISEATIPDPWGLGLKIRYLGLKFTNGKVPSVGLLRIVFTQCSVILNNCPLISSGTWAPLAELTDYACVLGQVDASLKCPSGGSTDCDDQTCNSECVSRGHAYGYCSQGYCNCP